MSVDNATLINQLEAARAELIDAQQTAIERGWRLIEANQEISRLQKLLEMRDGRQFCVTGPVGSVGS